MRRGTNLPAVGGFNQSVVLDLVRRAGEGISRVEIAEASGLSPQTVSNLTRRLLADGLVRESGKRIVGPGKPRTILTLDPRGGYAVGVHLDPSVVTYVVTDLEGRVVLDRRVRTPRQVQPDAVVAQMAQTIGDLVAASGVPADRVLGVGIAAPGPIDGPPARCSTRRCSWAGTACRCGPPWPSGSACPSGWRRTSRPRPPPSCGRPTASRTRTRPSSTTARGSASGSPSTARWCAAPRPTPATSATSWSAATDRCARAGTAAASARNASPAQMVREAADAGVLDLPARELGLTEVDRAFSRLATAAGRDDPRAVTILRRAGHDIGRALVLVANLLDIDTVVCGGPFWDRLAPVALPEVRRVTDGDPAGVSTHPVQVLETALGSDVAALGAAALVLDAVHSPRPAGLLITRALSGARGRGAVPQRCLGRHRRFGDDPARSLDNGFVHRLY